jgi:hypothetical protein
MKGTRAVEVPQEGTDIPIVEYELSPLSHRILQATATTVMLAVASGTGLLVFSRTVKRLHLLKGTGKEKTKIMVESTIHPRARGRVFDINRCRINKGKSKKRTSYIQLLFC